MSRSVMPRNIYYRFISFRINRFTLNSSSNEKNSAEGKAQNGDIYGAYGDMYHQGVIQSELSAVSCLAYYFSHISVW